MRCENCRVIMSRSRRRLRRPFLVIKVVFFCLSQHRSFLHQIHVASSVVARRHTLFRFVEIANVYLLDLHNFTEPTEPDTKTRTTVMTTTLCRWLLDCTRFFCFWWEFLWPPRICVFHHAKVKKLYTAEWYGLLTSNCVRGWLEYAPTHTHTQSAYNLCQMRNKIS